MSSMRWSISIGVCASVVLIAASAPMVAQGAQPPVGYPTSQVMINADNLEIGQIIPIRRGFWDADIAQGWGMDKAWHYHRLPSMIAQRNVMESTNSIYRRSTGNYEMTAYAYEVECAIGSTTDCEVVEEMEVIGVYKPATLDTYYGWPVGGRMGLLTMYCDNWGVTECPWWVTFSLVNINPATARPGGQVPLSAVPSPEPGLPADLRIAQDAFLDAPEVRALTSRVKSGELVMVSSYLPLIFPERHFSRDELSDIVR